MDELNKLKPSKKFEPVTLVATYRPSRQPKPEQPGVVSGDERSSTKQKSPNHRPKDRLACNASLEVPSYEVLHCRLRGSGMLY
jgi:hypothetical protein